MRAAEQAESKDFARNELSRERTFLERALSCSWDVPELSCLLLTFGIFNWTTRWNLWKINDCVQSGKKRIWKRVFFRGFQQIDSSKENVVFVRCNYIVWRESVRNWKLHEIFESSWVKVSLFSAKISISTFDRGYFLVSKSCFFKIAIIFWY